MTDTRDTRGIATFDRPVLAVLRGRPVGVFFFVTARPHLFVVFWHDGRLHFHPGDGVHIAKASRSAVAWKAAVIAGHRLRWGCPMATRTVTGCCI